MKKFIIILIALFSCNCTRNVGYIKSKGEAKWKELGYTVIGYEGFQYSLAGGNVWYLLKRKDSPGIIYDGFLQSYYGELQVYGPDIKSGSQLNLSQESINK